MELENTRNLTAPILIVDDQELMAKLTRSILRSLGLTQIVIFSSSEEAFEYLSQNDVSIIISDWNMPKITGLELLKRIRALERLKETPFLLLTAEAEADKIKEAKKNGVTDYITKPFSPKTLIEKIRNILQL